MNKRYSSAVLTGGTVLLLMLLGNGILAVAARDGEWEAVGAACYLAVLFAALVYAFGLKCRLKAAGRRLAAFRQVWRGVPCAAAVIRPGEAVEICGDAELFHRFGLTAGESAEPAARLLRTERHMAADGSECFLERLTLPLPPGEGRGEVLFDVSVRVREAQERESEYGKMLKILVNSFEMKDPYSQGHSETVSNLAHELASALGLPAGVAAAVTRAALLHDIGKIIIPPELLGKTGELMPGEFETIKAHCEVGADILASLAIFRAEAEFVRHHHERWDGGGYPAGLRGDAIPLGARIIAVVDAFDAMTTGRSPRGRREVGVALAVIGAEKGRQFDPLVAEAFIDMVREGRGIKT